MRIVHVISQIDPKSGGPSTALAGLTIAQKRAGLDVVVATTFADGEELSIGDQLKLAGVDIHLIGPVTGPLRRHPGIESTLHGRIQQADVVHIHTLWEEIQHQAARTARVIGKPYLIRPCGMLDPWSLSQSRLKKRLYMMWRLKKNLDKAAAIHFTTTTEKTLTAPLHIAAPAIVEPNGVDLLEFESLPAAGSFRAKHPEIGRRIVLFLSRVHPKKGLDLLIPAFAKTIAKDTVLVIAGPDSEGYADRLKAQGSDLGLGDRMIFTGMLKGRDRIEAFVDASLFVLPSHQENFGIAVVEALASGTPVLVSDKVNLCDDIKLAGVGDAIPLAESAWTQHIVRWLTDEARCADAAKKSRPFVWEHYDWNAIAARWITHYEKLAGRKAS